MASAGSAQAASEVAQLAAGDNRVGIIATLALPALGWVAFNIGGPALNQLANMDKTNKMRYTTCNGHPSEDIFLHAESSAL